MKLLFLVQVVKKLISKVNRNSLNSKGLTARDIAEHNGFDHIKEFLEHRGGRSAESLPEKEPLHEFLKSKQGPFEKETNRIPNLRGQGNVPGNAQHYLSCSSFNYHSYFPGSTPASRWVLAREWRTESKSLDIQSI